MLAVASFMAGLPPSEVISFFKDAFYRYDLAAGKADLEIRRFATRSQLHLADYCCSRRMYGEANAALMRAQSQANSLLLPLSLSHCILCRACHDPLHKLLNDTKLACLGLSCTLISWLDERICLEITIAVQSEPLTQAAISSSWYHPDRLVQEGNMVAAVLLEQAAMHLLHMDPPAMRKWAFHLVLAALRFSNCSQAQLADAAYRSVTFSRSFATRRSVHLSIKLLVAQIRLSIAWEL